MTYEPPPRASGILLHPSSLPGPYGIGDIGSIAREFVDRLAQAEQTYWQVLPLGPTGFGDSPYQPLSSFAGNSNLISLDGLADPDHPWLTREELSDHPPFRERRVAYETVIDWHDEMLTLAYERFRQDTEAYNRFAQWCHDDEQKWLDEFALYMALKERNQRVEWLRWREQDVAYSRVLPATALQDRELRGRIEQHQFRQWLFFSQWTTLRNYAHERGIRLIGDLPFYVGHDSADVWANRGLFDLRPDGTCRTVAGVPPDSFSLTGQRWGNPIYLWDRHRATNYQWWIARLDATLRLVDSVRIDHFRAFYNYWEVPSDAPTAIQGAWRNGPRDEFFEALGEARRARIIAEDLGDNMDNPIALRRRFRLPGMVVLQFAFTGTGEEQGRFSWAQAQESINQQDDAVIYTGTHDNRTVIGWWFNEADALQHDQVDQRIAEVAQDAAQGYSPGDAPWLQSPHWKMIWLGMTYPYRTFIASLQDMLGLGDSARMNTPGMLENNWRWRCTKRDLAAGPWDHLKQLTEITGRRRSPASSGDQP